MEIVEEGLLPAIKSGRLEMVQLFLKLTEHSPYLKYYSTSASHSRIFHQGQYYTSNGHLLIHVAAKYGRTEIVKLLLKYFDVDVVTTKRETALMLAAAQNHEATVNFLLEHGADINCETSPPYNGHTALLLACRNGHENIVKILLEHGASVFSSYNYYDKSATKNNSVFSTSWQETLNRVVKKGQKNIVELLLCHNVYRQRLCQGLLLIALQNRNLEMVKMILDRGISSSAFVNFLSCDSSDILVYAGRSSSSIVQLLIDYGVNLNVNFFLYHRTYPEAAKDYLNVCRPLVRQIVEKMQREIVTVSKGHLQAINNDPDLSACKRECEEEIDCMREQKFDDSVVSLHDVFTTKDLVELACYAKNENILNFVKSNELTNKFPIYSNAIKRQLQKGCHRNFLLKRVKNFFSATTSSNNNPKIPMNCAWQIFSHLSNDDLVNLGRAMH